MPSYALVRQRPNLVRAFNRGATTAGALARGAAAFVGSKYHPGSMNLKRPAGDGGAPAKKMRLTNNYRVRTLGHGKEKIRSKKKRVLNRSLKGKAKKFQMKVMKAVNYTKNFGEYTYIGQKQLRQTTCDKWGTFADDFNGRDICIGSNRALADAAAICFNNKGMGNNFNITVNNFQPSQNLESISETLSFFFKSTSSHVVNIEMYEFTAKDGQGIGPVSAINESLDDFTNRYAAHNTATESTFTFADPGCEVKYLTELHKHYFVKVHRMKLPPGHTASKVFKRRGRVMEAIKHLDSTENLQTINKGMSIFYFRVINDITCSTAATAPAIVHNWNSNPQGGVAMQYKRVIRVVAPNQATSNDKPTIAVGNWCSLVGAELDQQVCVANPIATTTVG